MRRVIESDSLNLNLSSKAITFYAVAITVGVIQFRCHEASAPSIWIYALGIHDHSKSTK